MNAAAETAETKSSIMIFSTVAYRSRHPPRDHITEKNMANEFKVEQENEEGDEQLLRNESCMIEYVKNRNIEVLNWSLFTLFTVS